jgi:hypothetical protein
MNQFELTHHLSLDDINNYKALVDHLKNTPIPNNEILANLGLFLTRSSLGRILFITELYEKIINSHGIIMEMGVRWGQNLALFSALRSLYEPFNTSRKIVGFDTFSGFPEVWGEDGVSDKARAGNYDVISGYENTLEKILEIAEKINPKANEKKFELIKGDVRETLPCYLKAHRETLVSLVYFDLDLYAPTKAAIEALLPFCHRGTVFAFDELCYTDFPGETLAMREVFSGRKYTINRSPLSPQQSYLEFQD